MTNNPLSKKNKLVQKTFAIRAETAQIIESVSKHWGASQNEVVRFILDFGCETDEIKIALNEIEEGL